LGRLTKVFDIQPATEESPFPRVAIIGFGLIGGSIALAIKRRWPASLIVAIDEKPVIEVAMRSHAADVGGDGLVMAGDVALAILAAPVLQNIRIIETLPEFLPPDALVTDVSSTKRQIVAAAGRMPSLQFIGGHPMAGAARGGLPGARADLFDGHPWILTPDADHAGPLERLDAFIKGLGAVPHIMSAELHDRLVGAVSHLPQLTASALMHVVGRLAGDAGFELAGPGLTDTTRLADSPANIWRDIAATNQETLREALDMLIRTLTDLRDGLGDGDEVDAIFTSAARWRHALLRARGDA
jgi:prephenate dehydrogenase